MRYKCMCITNNREKTSVPSVAAVPSGRRVERELPRIQLALVQRLAALMLDAGEPTQVWDRTYAVWAREEPFCRTLRFTRYGATSNTLRAHIERDAPPRWPLRRCTRPELPHDALRLEFSFHASEADVVLPWLRDICLRRDTPLLAQTFPANLTRIRAGSRYEWTDRGWDACEAVNAERARREGRAHEHRPNRPPESAAESARRPAGRS